MEEKIKKLPFFKIEVIEIYPEEKKKKGMIEYGFVHIEFVTPDWTIEIKNIKYFIEKNKNVWVNMPSQRYEIQKDEYAYAPTINFNHIGVVEKIRKEITEEVLVLANLKKKKMSRKLRELERKKALKKEKEKRKKKAIEQKKGKTPKNNFKKYRA